jgi:hypothetical protein
MDWSPVLIYLTRDGRAVVNSRLRKYPERGVEVESREWKKTAERMNAFYAKFPAERRLTVTYEHLASDPAESIREICQFLQLDFEPQMLRFWEQEHHTTFGNDGTRSLIARNRIMAQEQQTARADTEAIKRVRGRHGAHYDDVGLAIKLDLRWTRELTPEQLAVFDAIAGDTNKQFAYEPAERAAAR